jgi:type VI protein secretion system component VasF
MWINKTLLDETMRAQTTLSHPEVEWWEYLLLMVVLAMIIYIAYKYDLYAVKNNVKKKMLKGLRR